jgi:hypothetical protein
MLLEKIFKRFRHTDHPVKRLFFVLSTGRCGTRYVSNLLDAAPDATVLHQPQPGCERINPDAYELFADNPQRYLDLAVEDFDLLQEHADIYKNVTTPVYGDCYNSLYPFGIALFRYFQKQGLDVKFIHLVRNPVACASSILRAEGPFGIGERKNFKIRAEKLFSSTIPAEIASEIWININRNIHYQMKHIEKEKPGSTRLVRLEDIQKREQLPAIRELFQWIGCAVPDDTRLLDVMLNEDDEVRHSHQKRLDDAGIQKICDEELSIIARQTGMAAGDFGY